MPLVPKPITSDIVMVPIALSEPDGWIGYATTESLVDRFEPLEDDYFLSVGYYPSESEATVAVQEWIDNGGEWKEHDDES